MRRLVFLSAWIVATCAPATLGASNGPIVDIPERARGAQGIVVATVTAVAPEWQRNAHGDKLIVSRIGLRVEETIKGIAAATLTLDLEGGTLDGVTLGVSSLPRLRPGERAVFFLDAGGNGSHTPHRKGLGILKLDAKDQVPGSSLKLDDVRRMSKGASR